MYYFVLSRDSTEMRLSLAARIAVAAVVSESACSGSSASERLGVPQRLVAGISDTVIVNDMRPVQILVRGVNATGKPFPVTGVQFARIGGDSVKLSRTGTIACESSSDTWVRAWVERVEARLLVRCSPVDRLYFSAGPVQFVAPGAPPGGVLSDSAQPLPLVAVGPDNKPVELLRGTVFVPDTSIASAEGLWIRPKRPGGTTASVEAGGRATRHGVSLHVYKRLRQIDEMQPDDRWVSVPITLGRGEVIRWTLPPPRWMFTMLPYEDSLRGLRLRVERANCGRMQITPRRYNCLPGDNASIVIYHPGTPGLPHELSGEILIYREDRSIPAALRSARPR